MTQFGPTGDLVYQRTYSRTKPDGSKETWPETVRRVVDGNISLAPGSVLEGERETLLDMMERMEIIPAGRHLWASGVSGRQYLFNCHVSGWSDDPWEHFSFSFLRLMEGGGVGANYSNRHLQKYPEIVNAPTIHIVCDEGHPDYQKLNDNAVLSPDFDSDWPGAIEVEDSREGWAEALTELFRDHYRVTQHPDRVFDVSRVRAEGARLKTFGGSASGPLPLAIMLHEVANVLSANHKLKLDGVSAMEIDHAIAQCVVSGGNRRSARMSIMRWDDWQIEEFIHLKEATGAHWTTNISVEVDQSFWEALADDEPHPRNVLRWISEGMLANGEPGVWDSDLSNQGEPGEVIATNPCGEIPLEAWENCNLGHVNLGAFVEEDGEVSARRLGAAHVFMTRFLLRATYGDVNDERQADVLARNRRIGVGHLGLASFLAKMGFRYSEAPEDPYLRELLEVLSDYVERSAREYAHELRIPVPVKTRTVAPTGTIAKLPGVSEGIHPIFSKFFIRRVRLSTIDRAQIDMIAEYQRMGYHVEPCQYAANTMVIEIPTMDSLLQEVSAMWGDEKAEAVVQSAADLTLEDMLDMQALYQRFWADNAVSYTANVDPGKYDVDQIMSVIEGYGEQVKGFTIFPETSMPQAPYERISKEQFHAYEFAEVADSVDEECMSGACPVR